MDNYEFTKMTEDAVAFAASWAKTNRKEFITPEHILLGITKQKPFSGMLKEAMVDISKFVSELYLYDAKLETIPEDEDYILEVSLQTHQVFEDAKNTATFSGHEKISVPHLIRGILTLDDSTACYILHKHFGDDDARILAYFSSAYDETGKGTEEDMDNDDPFNDFDITDADSGMWDDTTSEGWKQLVTCINDRIKYCNPLIGREEELERTIQILCRRDKNNPLHIGESGVGKTTIVYGLAAMIEKGDVPEMLKNNRIYSLDMGTLIAGAQLRGEFEKRLKSVLDGIELEGNGIVYLDEIHNLIGAGQVGDGSMDASNMLKPYLDEGKLRFIGSTTYQEYNRYMAKSKGVVRRFQQIDIQEPSVEDTIKIIEGLQHNYEDFHGVKYTSDAIRYAVEKSDQLIADRFLPDKAIDIIDEAGAYRQLHPLLDKNGKPKQTRYQRVDIKLMSEILAKVCKIDAKALSEDSNEQLETLASRISSQIYGQDSAVKYVVEAVQMAKAGLLDTDKPLASLLFVGPTGVGKTEVCRVLAKELGIELVRFDMSEYTEKHTVAKLIGSPAGYVGYEDGGLLTDAIRKTPNCVLLLDEIEKAHPDIYNILLQVMDYAKLTDNRGNKADFKNVILIMTSNAGAQYASMGTLGFGNNSSRGDAMLQTVRKTFKPEFLNRLSGTVVFNDMDMKMAELILDKKLRQLQSRLAAKNVTLEVTSDVRKYLLEKGYTKQYGAREMDRAIQGNLNPLLMREILFGKLKKGGGARISLNDGVLVIS